jgi:superfamily II DNA or RNA helicase
MSLPLFIQQACRVLTPVEGKRSIIIDYVNNVQRHGLPTDNHEWSLSKSVEKRKQHNDDGTLSIRQCSECFRCFQGNICPYCKTEHIPKGRELKQMQEVELKKYQAEEQARLEEIKKLARMEVGRARTRADLERIAKERGYDKKWVYVQCKIKHISW